MSVLALFVQLLPLMLLSAIALVPFWKLYKRAGRRGWWALIVFIPFFGLIVSPWVLLGLSGKRHREPDLGQVFS